MTDPAPDLHLISHVLCPYVQRAVITLAEKGAAFRRTDIDLAAKPDWFRAISPLGKVPVLVVDGTTVLFESAVICEYLEETQPGPRLHPEEPLQRARHRAWVELASATLANIAGFYAAPDADSFESRRAELSAKLATLEGVLGDGPWFAGERFSLVDAAFGPVFRYLDAFERLLPAQAVPEVGARIAAWRRQLARRPSVAAAVVADYPSRLDAFLRARDSHLARLIAVRAAA